MRDMMDALSTMIEQDRRGEDLDPTFDEFMEKFGDFFPGAENLEDVVRMMAERAAAAEAMFNSLSPDQQSELRSMFAGMMENMELNFSLNRLVSNLRMATPDIDWSRAHRMRGDDGSPFADATSVAEQLGQLKGLEEFLGQANAAQGLPEVDVEAVRRNLGDDAARHVVRLQKALQGLKDQGFVDRQGRQLHLTPKGFDRSVNRPFVTSSPSFAIRRRSACTASRACRAGETARRPPSPGSPVNRSR